MSCSSSGAGADRRRPSERPSGAPSGADRDARVAAAHHEKLAIVERLVVAYEELLIRLGAGDFAAATRAFEKATGIVDEVRSLDRALGDLGAPLLPAPLAEDSRERLDRVEELGARVASEIESQRARMREELGHLHGVKGAVQGYRPYSPGESEPRRVDFSG